MPRTDGIDTSRYQHPPYAPTPVDWLAVRGAGVEWVAVQALKGESVDPSFAYNRAELARVGFPHRLLYGYPTTPLSSNYPTDLPWDDQARHFLDVIGPLAPGEGVMCDAEVDGITEALTLQWCETVEAATGRPCAVYTGGYTAGGALWHSPRIFNGDRPRVFAAYTAEHDAHDHADGIAWDAWQWSGSGSCPGVSTQVDLDQVDNPAAFDACCGRDLDQVTDTDVDKIAAAIWTAWIHNHIAGAEMHAQTVLGYAHAEALDGAWSRLVTNMVNGEAQRADDLLRFTHAEAYGAATKTDRILTALREP